VDKLFGAVDKALSDGIKPPAPDGSPRASLASFVDGVKGGQVRVAAAGSRETSTAAAIMAATKLLETKLNGNTYVAQFSTEI